MGALTSLGTPTIITKTTWGNKRAIVCTLTFGDGTSTWPAAGGIAFPASSVGLQSFEYVGIDSDGQASYKYIYDTGYIDAYVGGGASALMVQASGIVPTAGTIRLLCIGYGAY